MSTDLSQASGTTPFVPDGNSQSVCTGVPAPAAPLSTAHLTSGANGVDLARHAETNRTASDVVDDVAGGFTKKVGDVGHVDGGSLDRQSDDDCVGVIPQSWTQIGSSILQRGLFDVRRVRQNVKLLCIVGTVLVAVGLVPFPHRINARVTCEPVTRRFVAAPFDGRLLKSHAIAGQQVHQGDLLATLDGSDLRSQLANLRSEHKQASQRMMAALSSGDHAEAKNERLETEQMEREIALLEDRQRRLEIRAPIDGIIVTGDLERAEGAPLSVGDSLFEIASLDTIVAEVAIPESEVNFAEPDMPVSVFLDATSEATRESTVSRIHLRSELRDHQIVFVADSILQNEDGRLRPGMSGTATLHAGLRPLAWVWFYRPFRAVRQWTGW